MTQDWSVSIEAPNGTVSPRVFEDAVYVPRVNGRPEVRVPTDYDDKYQSNDWDNVPMTVSIDGAELPIDRLEERQTTRDDPGSTAHTMLVGRGGPQLRRDVDEAVDAEPVHSVAERLITETTDHSANVDEPTTTEESGVVIQSASDTADYRTLVASPFEETSPVKVQDGTLSLYQSAFISEAESGTADADGTISDSKFSGGSAVRFASRNDTVRVSFSTDYRIPLGSVQVAVRLATNNPLTDFNGPGLRFEIDGHPVARFDSGWGETDTPLWLRLETPSALDPGEHTLSITQTSEQTESTGIDVVGVVDNRFEYSYPKTTGTNGYLAGPELYPDEVKVVFQDAELFRAVEQAQLQVDVDSVQSKQAIALSGDSGETWEEVNNATFTVRDFPTPRPSVRARLTLSRHGARSGATPTTGINPTTVSSFEITGTLTDLPLVIDQEFSGPLDEVLTELATTGRADFVWAYEANGSDRSVEFAPRGQRSSVAKPAESRLELEQDAGELVEKAIVEGGEQPVTNERLTATTASAVGLSASRLLAGSETVYVPQAGKSDSYQQLERGTDYRVDYQEGTITALADGAIDDGDVITVDYRFQPRAVVTADGVSDPATERFELPPLSSTRACRAAARRIVDVAQTPQQQAGLRTGGTDPSLSVVEPITTQIGDLHPSEVQARPGATDVKLADRKSIRDLVADLKSRIRSTARSA